MTAETLTGQDFKEVKKKYLSKGPYKWTFSIGAGITVVAAVMGLPIPAVAEELELAIPFLEEIIAAIAGTAAAIKGFFTGKSKWKKHLGEYEKEFKKAKNDPSKQAEIIAEIEEKDAFVYKIPLIGSLIHWLAKKAEKYHKELIVADLGAGIGLAVGYKLGALIGTIIMPGVGTAIGSVLGLVIGYGLGMLFGAKIATFVAKNEKRYDQLRTAMLGGLIGAGLGAAMGALIGSLIFPGLGTAAGAAIGAGVGTVCGIAQGLLSYHSDSFLKNYSRQLNVASGVSTGAALGSVLGGFLPLPGIGVALGSVIGALAGACITWGLTKYGHALKEKKESIKHTVSSYLKEKRQKKSHTCKKMEEEQQDVVETTPWQKALPTQLGPQAMAVLLRETDATLKPPAPKVCIGGARTAVSKERPPQASHFAASVAVMTAALTDPEMIEQNIATSCHQS